MSDTPNPVGRPTLYKPEYCDGIVDHCSNGASLESFAAEIDVCRSTLIVWAKAHPEFLQAATRAKAKSKAWWEITLRNLASTGVGNATAAVFGITNMSRQMDIELPEVDWLAPAQQVQHTGKDGASLADEAANAALRVKDRLSRLAGD